MIEVIMILSYSNLILGLIVIKQVHKQNYTQSRNYPNTEDQRRAWFD